MGKKKREKGKEKMINEQNSLFLFIDVQEKLVAMLAKDKAAKKAAILSQAAKYLNIDCVLTEQYPAGLGSTIEPVKYQLPENAKFFEKTAFNALADEQIADTLAGKENVFVFGIEAHICVLQTAMALLEKGFNVYVVKDACASRDSDEFKAGINFMENAGAKIVTTEIVLFEMLKSSKNPMFKPVQFLIK